MRHRFIPVFCAVIMSSHAAPVAAQTIEDRIVGNWASLACELRPGQLSESGGVPATWLTRKFTYNSDGTFEGRTRLYADPGCSVGLVTFDFAGRYILGDDNPAIRGARNVDYHLDQRFDAVPELAGFVEQMNALPDELCGDADWTVGTARPLLSIDCAPFGLTKDSYLKDFDLVYIPVTFPDLLFMGARHVDGRGFNTEADRPIAGLQVPLLRGK